MKKILAVLLTAVVIFACLPAAAEEAAGGNGEDGMNLPASAGACLLRFAETCRAAAVPGEPEQVEYDVESFDFNTRTPLNVDAKAVVEAAGKLFSELLADEASADILRSVPGLNPDEVLKTTEAALAAEDLPDVEAYIYTSGDENGTWYVVAEATRKGSETAAYRFDMLSPESGTVVTGLQGFDSGTRINLMISRNSYTVEYFRDDRYCMLQGEMAQQTNTEQTDMPGEQPDPEQGTETPAL